jgi:hypothetical protein
MMVPRCHESLLRPRPAWSVVYLVAYLWLIDAQDGEIAWWHVVLMVFSQLRAFIGAILRGEPALTGPGDAVANMAVIDACYAAAGLPRRESAPARDVEAQPDVVKQALARAAVTGMTLLRQQVSSGD